MLDNNSLLTEVSELESATVSGGISYQNLITLNPDGTITINTKASGYTIQQNGTDITGTDFTSTTALTFGSDSLPTLQGSAVTPDNPQKPVTFSLTPFSP